MYTIVTAQILGIFFTFLGASMVINGKDTVIAIEKSVENRSVLWLWGMIMILMGAVVSVLNNEWSAGLPLLITIIGWLALIKGIFILWFPGAAASLYKKLNSGGVIALCGIISLVLGIVLLYWS
jgi:hypothetical protein